MKNKVISNEILGDKEKLVKCVLFLRPLLHQRKHIKRNILKNCDWEKGKLMWKWEFRLSLHVINLSMQGLRGLFCCLHFLPLELCCSIYIYIYIYIFSVLFFLLRLVWT